MNSLSPFLKKEIQENIRTNRFTVFLTVFVLFGLMNPLVAKLTPWIYERMSESLQKSGLAIGTVTVTALESWEQFYKNIPLALLLTLILFSGIFAREFDKGTLTPLIVKGLSKTQVFIAKFLIVALTWSLGFWLCYAITYFYSDFYWTNSIAHHLALAAFCWWLFGMCAICLEMLFSTMFNSASLVLLFVGISFAVTYVLNLFAKLGSYLPLYLAGSSSMLTDSLHPADFTASIVVTAITCFVLLALALAFIRKRVI